MHDLVVTALQECGVDGGKGDQALACKTGCKRDCVLLGDSDVKDTVWEPLLKPGG